MEGNIFSVSRDIERAAELWAFDGTTGTYGLLQRTRPEVKYTRAQSTVWVSVLGGRLEPATESERVIQRDENTQVTTTRESGVTSGAGAHTVHAKVRCSLARLVV